MVFVRDRRGPGGSAAAVVGLHNGSGLVEDRGDGVVGGGRLVPYQPDVGLVAEEAAVTAEFMGNKVRRNFDVGVAGLHRLLSVWDELRDGSVYIVVAGMEGALPSVVAGMVKGPVIAVPTSVGYGASFGGIAALLGMLNSCSPGVSVVNIDNGFGAGYLAGVINRQFRVREES